MDRIQGFAPLVGTAPHTLILGSAPSVASLEKHQYYGKPQNAFWKIMGELFGAGPALSYPERVKILTSGGVAVWDVLASCVRPGSLDSAIDMRTAEVNQFEQFFKTHMQIRNIYFNGRKAEELFNKRVLPELDEDLSGLCFTCLPSTSPAMATLDFAAKLEQWRVVSLP